MPVSDAEALAGLKLLVVLSRADRALSVEEHAVFTEALEGAKLPGEVTAKGLLDGTFDLDELLNDVKSREGRDVAFSACFAMAYSGSTCLPEEQAILDRMALAWSVPKERQGPVGRVLREAGDTACSRPVAPSVDPMVREAEVKRRANREKQGDAVQSRRATREAAIRRLSADCAAGRMRLPEVEKQAAEPR